MIGRRSNVMSLVLTNQSASFQQSLTMKLDLRFVEDDNILLCRESVSKKDRIQLKLNMVLSAKGINKF